MSRFRPRLRFSLRAMFVLVTIIGGWLGYQLNWIRQRRELLSSRLYVHGLLDHMATPPIVPAAPGLLRLFGEEGIGIVMRLAHEPRYDEEEMERTKRLFPEARTLWPNYDGGLIDHSPLLSR